MKNSLTNINGKENKVPIAVRTLPNIVFLVWQGKQNGKEKQNEKGNNIASIA